MKLRTALSSAAAATALIGGMAPVAGATSSSHVGASVAPDALVGANGAVSAPSTQGLAERTPGTSIGALDLVNREYVVRFTAAQTAALAKLPACADVWPFIAPHLPIPVPTRSSEWCKVPGYARTAVSLHKKLGLSISVHGSLPVTVTVTPFYW